MHIVISALHQPSKPTGVCRHAANLAQSLAETDEVSQVTLIVGAWQNDYFSQFFSSEKINLVCIDIKNNSISRNLWFLFGLPRLIQHLQPILIHLSFPLPFLSFLFPCQVVSTIHDLYAYEYPENFGRTSIFNRLFFKLCITQSDGLVCVSKTTLESLRKYFSKIIFNKPTTAIYNYVDFSHITSKSNQAVSIDTAFLLCVGQHRKNKNLGLLVEAYSSLLTNSQFNNATKLVIVGSSGPETSSLHRQIEALNLTDKIYFLSALEDGELRWLYEHCTLFAICSSTEGFCIPLVEALFLGCKCVCSNIPIFQEVGSSACTYFNLEGDSVTNLSQAIIHSFQSNQASKPHQDDRFSKQSIAAQYLKFYRDLISG